MKEENFCRGQKTREFSTLELGSQSFNRLNEAQSDVSITLDGSAYPGRKMGCYTSEKLYPSRSEEVEIS